MKYQTVYEQFLDKFMSLTILNAGKTPVFSVKHLRSFLICLYFSCFHFILYKRLLAACDNDILEKCGSACVYAILYAD